MKMAPPPWDDDNKDGESSLQLLVGWLINEGNYARWWQGDTPKRDAICDEIRSLFKAHGILHRTSAGIKMKIRRLETSVVHAQSVLRENGYVDLANLDDADMSLMSDILGRYPAYDFVAPLMSVMKSEQMAHNPVVCRSLGWDADRVLEKTTMDVLLKWITTPGNYNQWQNKPSARAATCVEINKLLHEQAIHNRTITSIYSRINMFERSWKRTMEILDRRGISGSVKLDTCDELVKNEISQCCRHFELLAPIMMAVGTGQTENTEQNQAIAQTEETDTRREVMNSEQQERNPEQIEANTDQNKSSGESEQEEKSAEDCNLESRWQEFLNAPAAPPDSNFATRHTDCSASENREINGTEVLEPPSDPNMNVQAATQTTEDEDDEDDWFEIVEVRRDGVVISQASANNTGREDESLRRQRLEELEFQHKRAQYEHEVKKRKIELSVETELARQKLLVETELARRKLLQAGLSLDYVNQVLPSCR